MATGMGHFLMTYGMKCWTQLSNAIHPLAKRPKKLSSQFNGDCTQYSGSDSEQEKGRFRTTLFYPVLDHMLNELNRRFPSKNCDIMNGIQTLNPTSDVFLKEKSLFPFARMYESNIEDLGHELHQFRRLLERKIQSGMQRPSSVVQLVLFIEPYTEVSFELFKLCKIAVSIPVSTASCELSFSALKLVKTHLRSTMSDDRLSNLRVLSQGGQRPWV